MTLLRSVATPRASSIENPENPITGSQLTTLVGGGHDTTAGIAVNETKALNMSGVWRAVTLRAGVHAGLPFRAYTDDADGDRKSMAATTWQQRLMSSPHPDLVPFDFWEQVHTHRLLWGNAYLRILRNRNGDVLELWPIHPSRVKAGRVSEVGVKIYVIDGDAENPFYDDKIMHIPGFGYDGVCGVSPIRMARQSIGLGLAAESYGGKLFGSGSLATGILQTEQRLTQEQADTIHNRWKAKRSGLGAAHDTIVLDNGAKFQQLSIPPEDAQFLETRQFQINEICRWFGVPPFLMFLTEKSTSWGTGLEQQALGWVKFDLKNDIDRVEQRMSRLLSGRDRDPFGGAPVYAKSAVEGLLRGDSTARSAFYTAMFNLGAYSTNEIRELEDRPPVEGGDVRYRPLNMGELGQFDTEARQTDAPAAKAPRTRAVPSEQLQLDLDHEDQPEEALTDA